jgi:hypothetical protein
VFTPTEGSYLSALTSVGLWPKCHHSLKFLVAKLSQPPKNFIWPSKTYVNSRGIVIVSA